MYNVFEVKDFIKSIPYAWLRYQFRVRHLRNLAVVMGINIDNCRDRREMADSIWKGIEELKTKG